MREITTEKAYENIGSLETAKRGLELETRFDTSAKPALKNCNAMRNQKSLRVALDSHGSLIRGA